MLFAERHHFVAEYGGAQRGTGAEHIRMMEAVKERTVSAHRQPGNGAAFLVFTDSVGLFHVRNQLFEKHVFVGCFPVILVDVPRVPSVRHDNNHRNGLLLGDGLVGDGLHLSHLDPVSFIVRIAMQQVENGIVTLRRVVVGRQVDGIRHFPT